MDGKNIQKGFDSSLAWNTITAHFRSTEVPHHGFNDKRWLKKIQ